MTKTERERETERETHTKKKGERKRERGREGGREGGREEDLLETDGEVEHGVRITEASPVEKPARGLYLILRRL